MMVPNFHQRPHKHEWRSLTGSSCGNFSVTNIFGGVREGQYYNRDFSTSPQREHSRRMQQVIFVRKTVKSVLLPYYVSALPNGDFTWIARFK